MIWRDEQEGARAGAHVATRIAAGVVTEAHVECRSGSGAWWHYACPAVGGASDARRARRREGARHDALAGLFLGLGTPDDDLVGALGMPPDPSAPTAERYALYRERRRRSGRPELATWCDVRELDRVLTTLAGSAEDRDVVPATYCALLTMMQALEREFETRVVLWFDAPAAIRHGASATWKSG